MSRFCVEVITLTPGIWPHLTGPDAGLVARAFGSAGLAELRVTHLRDFGKGVHHAVDDAPFGGGAGMVLCVEPLHRAIAQARARTPGPVLLLSPRGERFDQAKARSLANGPGLVVICGRYEGYDERVWRYVDQGISMGDYVLSCGNPAAWAIIDTVMRLRPGVLGNPDSIREESFSAAAPMLEYPHYTRPVVYDGAGVPDVLRSGHHRAVAEWRQAQALEVTRRHRPDLLRSGRSNQSSTREGRDDSETD